MKYLHEVGGEGVYYLDHRIVPEIRAMLAAMVSRLPEGGIRQRYSEVAMACSEDGSLEAGEDRLTSYPLHPRIKGFFDEHVGKYGHSSPLELVGSPTVFVEGISWAACWLLFDSPLCAGQEFSTRAQRRASWPKAVDSMDVEYGAPGWSTDVERLHAAWLDVFDAEVESWKEHLSTPENREAFGIQDKEPFRPALDRARWAIPGSFATGCVQTTNVRERARNLKDTGVIARAHASGRALWDRVGQAYKEALPGMAHLGLREAVAVHEAEPWSHLTSFLQDCEDGPEVEVKLSILDEDLLSRCVPRVALNTYCDPTMNSAARVKLTFRCSIAAARDWHRHRTAYPWAMRLVRGPTGSIMLSEAYRPRVSLLDVSSLLCQSTDMFDGTYSSAPMLAATCLPLGTKVEISAWMGLRDAVYMLELRENARGANFEYKRQAGLASDALFHKLGPRVNLVFPRSHGG